MTVCVCMCRLVSLTHTAGSREDRFGLERGDSQDDLPLLCDVQLSWAVVEAGSQPQTELYSSHRQNSTPATDRTVHQPQTDTDGYRRIGYTCVHHHINTPVNLNTGVCTWE